MKKIKDKKKTLKQMAGIYVIAGTLLLMLGVQIWEMRRQWREMYPKDKKVKEKLND